MNDHQAEVRAFLREQIDFDAERLSIVGQPVNVALPREFAALERELVRGARADYTPENGDRSYTKRITIFSVPNQGHVIALGTYRCTRGGVVVVNPNPEKRRALPLSKILNMGFVPLASIRLKQAFTDVRFVLSRIECASIISTAD